MRDKCNLRTYGKDLKCGTQVLGSARNLLQPISAASFSGSALQKVTIPLPNPQIAACMAHPGAGDEADHSVCTEGLPYMRRHPWLLVTEGSK